MKFPSREELSKPKLIDDDGFDRDLTIDEVEKQVTYYWVRIYLNDEVNIKPDDKITLSYDGEVLELTFVCFNKKSLTKDDDDITNYDSEDDFKILCCMIDIDRINKDSEDILFIRTLFKNCRWTQFQIYKREDLIVRLGENILNYYHIDF